MRQHQIIKAFMLALFLMTSLNLGAQIYRSIISNLESERIQREYPHFRMTDCGPPPIDESSRGYIELALTAAFIGACLRKLSGRLLYFAGLTGTAIFYISWWKYYFRLAEIAGSEIRFYNHIIYLYRATYLDICIAASIALLFLWELTCAIRTLLCRRAVS